MDAARDGGAVLAALGQAIEAVRDRLKQQTAGGERIDDHQVAVRALARLATVRAATAALAEFAAQYPEDCADTGDVRRLARLFAAMAAEDGAALAEKLRGVAQETVAALRNRQPKLTVADYCVAGRAVLAAPRNHRWILTDGDEPDATELRDSTRRFAQSVITPEAESIHREDRLVPETIIQRMAELGYFGMSVPEAYGGVGMSNLMMILATEELSAASLSAGGSLITRPEILTKALLRGGTETQKQTWLPAIARGEKMVAVAVTEPNIGSDVANLTCRAAPSERGGRTGYLLNGAKAWCTFAGRADILALLARTESDANLGHRGLSLFIVEKDPFDGHAFEMVQATGGRMTGKADATLGYRGMHSFTLQFEDYFVPAENLVGKESGRGKGFYLQMDGFAAGRLQTGGRAVGLAQAAVEAAATYCSEREQFGRPLGDYQNTQYELGRMAARLEAARQLTYSAARAMDAGADDAALQAAMAKLFASRAAVEITQAAQLLHGGWGYTEEYAISRYVADALVLPIFEGVEPILELKVIGRGLLQ